MSRAPDPAKGHLSPERLVYAGGDGCSTSVREGQLYRLSVSKAYVATAQLQTVRICVAERADSPAAAVPAGATAASIDELGVGIVVAAASGSLGRGVQTAPQTAAEIRIGPDGSALDLIWFQITSAERYDGRPLLLVGTWADGRPLPGADAMCIRVETSSGSKRAVSADELRSGAFLGVAKRLREVPPPLTPPVPPPGTPPPAGFFDSEALTAAALKAETIIRSPLTTPVSTPPSEPGPTSPQSQPTPPQSASTAQQSAAPPSDDDLSIERELEALHIAKDIAGEDEHAEIKPPELAPLIMAVGERKDVIRNIVRRTMDELVLRGQRSGHNHPALASLTRLAKLLSRLDAAGLENPTPPPPSHTLFAMDVLEQPDVARWGEPLPGWFPPPNHGEKYVVTVQNAFNTIKRMAAGPSTVGAVNAAVACLTDDRLLLSSFIRTFSGRIRFRALLVILREAAASMAPVTRVANHLTMAALRRLSARSEDPEDAIRSAWDAVDALRPIVYNPPPDLYPITSTRALEVLKDAAKSADILRVQADSEAASERMLLYAEAMARIGEQEAIAGLLQEGIAHLFEAWARLLRTGASPSRLESRIIISLTEAHLISPTAYQLAERLYWCKESEEDLHIEARACCVLAQLSGAAGRAEEARRYTDRAFEVVESMPPEQRDCEGVLFAAAGIGIMASIRTGRVEECFSYTRLAQRERSISSDLAHHGLDQANGGFRSYVRALDACGELFRFGLFLCAISDPNELLSVANTVAAMGEIYVRQGQWRRAAMCYTEALESSKRFRKAFPTDHPRIVRITAALERCQEKARLAEPLARRNGDAG